jgi:hypothetical protein
MTQGLRWLVVGGCALRIADFAAAVFFAVIRVIVCGARRSAMRDCDFV